MGSHRWGNRDQITTIGTVAQPQVTGGNKLRLWYILPRVLGHTFQRAALLLHHRPFLNLQAINLHRAPRIHLPPQLPTITPLKNPLLPLTGTLSLTQPLLPNLRLTDFPLPKTPPFTSQPLPLPLLPNHTPLLPKTLPHPISTLPRPYRASIPLA